MIRSVNPGKRGARGPPAVALRAPEQPVASWAAQTLQMDILAAGAIVFDRERRLLLVRRGRPPGAGLWSVPGGKARAGETSSEACVREVQEETGLSVRVVSLAGRVRRPAPNGDVFVIDDYRCQVVGDATQAAAGDDAAELGWFNRAEFDRLPLVPGLSETLAGWNLLPD